MTILGSIFNMSNRTKILKESPMKSREKLLDIINSINSNHELRDRALISFLYLTGCRIEEVVKFVKEKNLKKTKVDKVTKQRIPKPILESTYEGDPIRKEHIIEQDNRLIVKGVRILKRQRYIPRNIPIPKNNMEQPLIDILKAYLNTLSNDSFLFNISRRRAGQIISKAGLYPHYMRHMRNTHLAEDYGLTSAELQQFNGWASSNSADAYIHLDFEHICNRMGCPNVI